MSCCIDVNWNETTALLTSYTNHKQHAFISGKEINNGKLLSLVYFKNNNNNLKIHTRVV